MYRMLLVDDHVLFREGMRNLISHWPDVELVGEANNGEEALALARTLQPDLVLMDIAMPVMDGIEATRLIAREFPAIRIVILTMSEDDEDLFEAVCSGAAGYVLKNIPSRRLHDELRGVLRGEAPLSGLMAAKILREFSALHPGDRGEPAGDDGHGQPRTAPAASPPAPAVTQREPAAGGNQGRAPAHENHAAAAVGPDSLTERERQVLQLLAGGLSNQEIADRICLSENTVKKHLHNILQKMHVNNRVEAAMHALRDGLISP